MKAGESALDDPLRRAAAFVAAHGDPLRRCAAAVLIGDRPLAAAIAAFESQQREDGAFLLPDAQSALGATRAALGLLDDLCALHWPLVERACAHVTRAQRGDGSWCDAGAGSETDVLATTGMLGGILAKTRWARPRTLDAAGAFLAARWSPDRVRGFDWWAIAAYAHFFANASHDLADEALQWCGRELERGYRQGRFDAVRTARVFAYCDASALPGARIEAGELVAAILSAQAPDGGWPASRGAAASERAASSLDAMVALGRLA